MKQIGLFLIKLPQGLYDPRRGTLLVKRAFVVQVLIFIFCLSILLGGAQLVLGTV